MSTNDPRAQLPEQVRGAGMSEGDRVFVPHRVCTEASGACLNEGRCLSGCRTRAKKDHERRITELERRLVAVETQLARSKR